MSGARMQADASQQTWWIGHIKRMRDNQMDPEVVLLAYDKTTGQSTLQDLIDQVGGKQCAVMVFNNTALAHWGGTPELLDQRLAEAKAKEDAKDERHRQQLAAEGKTSEALARQEKRKLEYEENQRLQKEKKGSGSGSG